MGGLLYDIFSFTLTSEILGKLREIAGRSTSYNLVSIAGGLSFLHAVNRRTTSLALVDSDPEVNHYVRVMLDILLGCSSRWEFFELLSGHLSDRVSTGPLTFRSVCSSVRDTHMQVLPDSARRILQTFYPPEGFDLASCSTTSEGGVVHYRELHLAPKQFSWLCDWGAFSDEDAFTEMRESLLRLRPEVHTQSLEEWDFAQCPSDTLVLASNTDSPLFTANDLVLSAIECSGNPAVAYVSRTRDFSAPGGLETSSIREHLFTRPPIAVGISGPAFTLLSALVPGAWRLLSVEEYINTKLYDEECIAFYLGVLNYAAQSILHEALQSSLPIHQRLMLVGTQEALSSFDLSRRYSKAETLSLGVEIAEVYYLQHRVPYKRLHSGSELKGL